MDRGLDLPKRTGTGATIGNSSGPAVALGRAATIYPFIDFFQDIGVPLDNVLKQYRLPSELRENKDMIASNKAMFAFVSDVAREQGIDSIGWNAPRIDQMHLNLRSKLADSSTLLETLWKVCWHTGLDSNRVTAWLRKQGADYFFCHRGSLPTGSNGADVASMMRTVVVLSIIRGHLGHDWNPPDIGIEMTGSISPLVQESLGNTEFYSGQQFGWIHLPKETLHRPMMVPQGAGLQTNADDYIEPAHDLVASVKQLILPYLRNGPPSAQFTANMANRSLRSFQRDLAERGVSYREIIKQTRFESACPLLKNPSIDIQDIAFEIGYTDPAHFTRFFEQMAGVSPREYRNLITAIETPQTA
jgi:AraC-like DNA-binding protein